MMNSHSPICEVSERMKSLLRSTSHFCDLHLVIKLTRPQITRLIRHHSNVLRVFLDLAREVQSSSHHKVGISPSHIDSAVQAVNVHQRRSMHHLSYIESTPELSQLYGSSARRSSCLVCASDIRCWKYILCNRLSGSGKSPVTDFSSDPTGAVFLNSALLSNVQFAHCVDA